MATLQQYLQENFTRGIIDFSLRANVDPSGKTTFYIHPATTNGATLDFEVNEDNLTLIHETLPF